MPIYEFACPKCRRIFNFFSQRVSPKHLPTCPKCGDKKMEKQISNFALTHGGKDSAAAESEVPAPDLNDPRLVQAMSEMERDMAHVDENNPKHIARLMRKMKDMLPPGSMPKELDAAIKRLEAGEDPEKIEADMGDILGNMMGGEGGKSSVGSYTHDSGLYDY